MKIYFSPASPYVRKCMVTAHELGLFEQIEKLPSAANPVKRDASVVASNPLGKVPTFITDDAQTLYDSRVICEYLDTLAQGALFARGSKQRWQILTEQSLGDGLLDAALLARYEAMMRPEALRWADWTRGQMDKIASCLQVLEARSDTLGERVDIGTITLGCALGYLDFRFPDYDWRSAHPQAAAWFAGFNERPSMQATLPKA